MSGTKTAISMSCTASSDDRKAALIRRHTDGEHDQRQRVGEKRRADGDGDRLESIRAKLSHDRRPEERMRCEQ